MKKSILCLLIMMMFCKGVYAMELTRAVIHHTAGSNETDRDLTVEEIDRYHKEKGWDGIGYHLLIRKDGEICKGRDINTKGAHAVGRNDYIGIALTGYDTFTKEQIASLKELIVKLGIKHIERHHELCPGAGFDIEEIRKNLNLEK